MAVIHSPAESLVLHRFLAAAKIGGVEAKHNAGAFAATAATAAYKRNVAFGAPSVEVPGAAPLWLTGNAAVVYLLRNTLAALSAAERAAVDEWAQFASANLDSVAEVFLPHLVPGADAGRLGPVRAWADHHLTAALEHLNAALETRTWLVGERLSAADIAVGLSLHHLYAKVVDAPRRAAYPHVLRWLHTVLHQPHVAAVVGAYKLLEGAAPAAPKGGAAAKGADKPKDKAAEKPKKEEAKAGPAPAPAPAAAKKKDDDEEEDVPKEEKKPNPLDLLPPSTFILDDFKRLYRNEKDTRAAVLPKLWESFDPAGYSLWFAEYKYNDECTKLFMTCNLVGGMYQRMEKLHRYALGVTLILGSDAKQEITGLWMFRGDALPQILLDVDDSEHFTWSKVAWPPSEADKARIGDYLAWEIPGKKCLEGKIYV